MLTPEKMCEALPEHGLDVDDGLGVGHVVLLCAHGALLVHHHQVVGVDYTTLEQVVQAGPKTTALMLHIQWLNLLIIIYILESPLSCSNQMEYVCKAKSVQTINMSKRAWPVVVLRFII